MFYVGKVLYPHAQHRSKNAKKSGAFMSSAVRFDNQRKALLMETADPGTVFTAGSRLAQSNLLYKLQGFRQVISKQTEKYDNFSGVNISQSVICCYCGNTNLCSWQSLCIDYIDYSFVCGLYNKHNKTWTRGKIWNLPFFSNSIYHLLAAFTFRISI